ncbi:MAG: nucleotidyltransferase domain-containing protein [Candidatus Omnitrophota bacterium]
MDKNAVLVIIERFRMLLEAKGIKLSKIILYGSYAKGDYTPASDIDVVVISDDFADKSYWERIEILSDAIYEIFEPIEAVAMTTEEWQKGESFICDYAKDGEILYAA